jgi:hypothetical protein
MTTLVLFALLSAGPEPADPMPKFACKLRKGDDRFESAQDGKGVVWKITSATGIGGAVVDLTDGKAPQRITIRFVNLKNLESFTIADGTVRLSSQLERGGGKRVLHFDDKGAVTADAKASAGSLSVERGKDGIDVVLVSQKPGKQWTLTWVNEFR